MEAKQEFEVDHHHLNTATATTNTGTSFSQLLLGDNDDEDHEDALGVGVDQSHNNLNNITYSPVFNTPTHKAPQMLCFGGNYPNEADLANALTPQKSVITNSSDSSSASSCNHSTPTAFNSPLSKPNSLQKKRNGSGQEPVTKAGVCNQRQPKKTKAENPTPTGHARRREKLGERIAALQQLVSPFGKTDTASVLHEAMGYIKFLQDQVQVLCSPYLQRLPSSDHYQFGDGDINGVEVTKDLRSRGLCLIPLECTVHVAGSNGADFWSPAALGNNSSPSTTMQ